MLTPKQMEEIREHLNKAQSPLFYYDNDADGLCSFLILQRYLGRGKGVAVRSYPDLNRTYARKAFELGADYVFILDKPVVSKEFLQAITELGLPIVWIDHHDIGEEVPNLKKEFPSIEVYNWALNPGKEKSDEPVSYWSYKIAGKKEDSWISVMGCVADHYLPDFISEFAKFYPDLWTNEKVSDPFFAYYKTEIGRVAQALGFGLKDSISNVVQLQNYLISCKSPGEVLAESPKNINFRKKVKEIRQKYDSLLSKAGKSIIKDVLFFVYSGDLSISADLSNELSFLYPDKVIFVGFQKGGIINASMRGKGVKKVLERVLKKFADARGGGHEDAIGVQLKAEDLKEFKNVLFEELSKK